MHLLTKYYPFGAVKEMLLNVYMFGYKHIIKIHFNFNPPVILAAPWPRSLERSPSTAIRTPVEFMVDESESGQVFSRGFFHFPLPYISFHQYLHPHIIYSVHFIRSCARTSNLGASTLVTHISTWSESRTRDRSLTLNFKLL